MNTAKSIECATDGVSTEARSKMPGMPGEQIIGRLQGLNVQACDLCDIATDLSSLMVGAEPQVTDKHSDEMSTDCFDAWAHGLISGVERALNMASHEIERVRNMP